MLGLLPLSNYPYVGRLGLQGEVSFATQGAADNLRISARMKNVADWCLRFKLALNYVDWIHSNL